MPEHLPRQYAITRFFGSGKDLAHRVEILLAGRLRPWSARPAVDIGNTGNHQLRGEVLSQHDALRDTTHPLEIWFE